MPQAAGVQRLVDDGSHADQIQGFFDIAVDNIYAAPVLLGDLDRQKYTRPDGGLAGRWQSGSGTRLPNGSGYDLAIIDKRRPKANVSKS